MKNKNLKKRAPERGDFDLMEYEETVFVNRKLINIFLNVSFHVN